MLEYAALLDEDNEKKKDKFRTAVQQMDPEFHLHQISLAQGDSKDDRIFTHNDGVTDRIRRRRFTRFLVPSVLGLWALIQIRRGSMATRDYNVQKKQKEKEEYTAQTSRFVRMKKDFQEISSEEAFRNNESPQFRALDWIANQDPRQVGLDDPSLMQRYILAVLYFSTNGPHWAKHLNWLSASHECEWSDNGGVRKCDKDHHVTDISLWEQTARHYPGGDCAPDSSRGSLHVAEPIAWHSPVSIVKLA